MPLKNQNALFEHSAIVLTLLLVFGLVFCCRGYTGDSPQHDKQYEIIKPIYLMATYNSLNNKVISRDTVRAYLHANRYYDKSIVAFQCEIPVGTTMTIIGPATQPWYYFFTADRYFVKLSPDLSRGLEIVLQLDRGIEGSLDGLSSELFRRIE